MSCSKLESTLDSWAPIVIVSLAGAVEIVSTLSARFAVFVNPEAG
jgi:hypothetical protein